MDAAATRRKLTDESPEVSDNEDESAGETLFSIHLACPTCGISLPKLEPRNFSFNSVHGACMKCKGLGTTIEFDPDLLVVNRNLSLVDGALADYDPDRKRFRVSNMRMNHMEAIAKGLGFTINTPLSNLTEQQWNDFFYGPKKEITVEYDFSWENKQRDGRGQGRARMKFKGLLARMKLRYEKTSSQYIRDFIQEYTRPIPCPECSGSGLRKESLAVSFKGKNIAELARMSISSSITFFNSVKLNKAEKEISEGLMKEIKLRLRFLDDVGLPYLTLSRRANSLSGGESQRIRLGTQIGSGLEDVLYILDEPSIGLHNRDNMKLIKTLQTLRDKGNTVLVSEHDIDTMLAADWLIDIGPHAGSFGGEIIAEGPAGDIGNKKKSVTGQYLIGRKKTFLK